MNTLMRVGLGIAVGSLPGALVTLAGVGFPVWGSSGALAGVGLFLIGWLRRRRAAARGHIHECPGCRRARWCEECPEESARAMFCRECLDQIAKRKRAEETWRNSGPRT